MDIKRPRMAAGAISEIYIGASMEAMPMPMPPIKRNTINQESSMGSIIPNEDTAKAIPDIINTFLRPNLSLSAPANMAPTMQPTSAQEATQPVMAADRLYFC